MKQLFLIIVFSFPLFLFGQLSDGKYTNDFGVSYEFNGDSVQYTSITTMSTKWANGIVKSIHADTIFIEFIPIYDSQLANWPQVRKDTLVRSFNETSERISFEEHKQNVSRLNNGQVEFSVPQIKLLIRNGRLYNLNHKNQPVKYFWLGEKKRSNRSNSYYTIKK